MKIRDAKQMYTAQRSALWEKRQTLAKALKEPGGSLGADFDRVEITKELSLTDAQYNAVDQALQGITAVETAIRGAEDTRQQADIMAKAAEEMGKIMEIYRRIASGAKVPEKDQQKLMEYDFKLYMAAKQAALLAQENDEEYDSLWEDEEEAEKYPDSGEVAGNAEIDVPPASQVAASAEIPSEAIG